MVAISFIGGVPRETTDLSQVSDELLSHTVVSSTPRLSGIRTHSHIYVDISLIIVQKGNY